MRDGYKKQLQEIIDGEYQLTEENYKSYLNQEYEFFTTFDYESINGQVDYESDYYAENLLYEKYMK